MKKIVFYRLILLTLFILCNVFPAMGESAPVWDGTISVTFVDSPFVDIIGSGSTIFSQRHTDVTFTIRPHQNYYIISVDYPNYELISMGDTFSLTLKDVAYTTRVSIECMAGDTIIAYDCNGGEYINGTSYQELYSLTHHLRPNTSIGTTVMHRDHHTLIGWNTQADGSGDHIGLGSRHTVEKGSTSTLYAEWSPWSPAEDFEFRTDIETGKMMITAYKGNASIISIPECIDGKYVAGISQGAFQGCTAETIILPKSMEFVENGAFTDCAFTDLYYFDNLVTISDQSFINCASFSTVHINAIEAPRYVANDRHSAYADKVDLLILNKDKHKIVLFGGSGTYYSINAQTIADALPDYQAINLGINAWFNGQAQLEIMLPYVGCGDVLLHSPEMMSEYQFLRQNDMGLRDGKLEQDARFFMCTELNYDLLSLVDLRHVTAFFDTYSFYNKTRLTQPKQHYSDYVVYTDALGDYEAYRFVTVEEIGSISGEAGLNMDLLSPENMTELNSYYDRFSNKGCKVLRAFACENRDGLTQEDIANIDIFEQKFIEMSPYPVINRLNDVLYPTTYFCDTDWHLTYDYSVMNTQALIPHIIEHIGD